MSAALEIEIQQLLKELGDTDLVADALLKKYSPSQISNDDKQSIANFLFEAGLYPSLTEFLTTDLSRTPLPWNLLSECLHRTVSPIDPILIEALEKGAKEQGQLGELCWSGSMDRYLKSAGEHRLQARQERLQGFLSRRQKLLDDIAFLKSQNLLDREKISLDELGHIFPEEKGLQPLIEDWKERKAFDVFNKKSPRTNSKSIKVLVRSEDHSEALEMIHASCLEALEEFPELAMDFCVMMYWFEDFERAHFFLLKTPETLARAWFEIELLLKQRRAIEALNFISLVETQSSHDPESPFLATYYRAQAFWLIAKKDKAVELMTGLVEIRPQYRSAASLLSLWRGLK